MLRRRFLAALPFYSLLPGRLRAQNQAPVANFPLFESVPPGVSGITWVHENGLSEDRFLPETTGAGCAFLDYDNDGWMDLYLVNSGFSDFYQPKTPLRNALYKNNRDGAFTDVTEKAGVPGGIFGMGVAVGDYDNDGFPDIFLTGVNQCILYHNNGDGTFTDVTAKSGISVPGWSVSAVWFDYDADGRLDLFVGRYVLWTPRVRHACGANPAGRHYYCTPQAFPPTTSLLFHNNGDGTFTEVGHENIVGTAKGKNLGVVATDINNDGRMDLFVSNDTERNFLFMNRGPDASGKTRWEEIGIQADVSYGQAGNERSGMGVDAADFNGDGWQDLFVCNIDHEFFSLYENRHNETFRDVAMVEPIGRITRVLSGWGVKFFDFDNDSEIDIIFANGHPNDMIGKYSPVVTYRQPMRLFRRENGHYRDVTAEAGPAFAEPRASRGLAIGDFNNDGRVDVLVLVNGAAPVLLKNRSGEGNHWLGIKLMGAACNRDAVGALIRWSVEGRTSSRLKSAGGSFLSSHDPRIVLGLGAARKVDWLEVHWPLPSRRVQRFESPPVDCYLTLAEGKDLVPSGPAKTGG
jgi:hypothetical protein